MINPIFSFTLYTKPQGAKRRIKIPVCVFLYANYFYFLKHAKNRLYNAVAINCSDDKIALINMTLLRFITFYFLIKFKKNYELKTKIIDSVHTSKEYKQFDIKRAIFL